ncbi:MAG: hypothetical protein ACUVR8_05955 [Acidobacteriota bacterium]
MLAGSEPRWAVRWISLWLLFFLISFVPGQQRAIPPDVAKALAETKTILQDVSRLRELPIKRPIQSGYRSRKEVERVVIQDLDASNSPEEFANQAKMLTALGLVPRNYALREELIRLLTEQIAGFYRPKTGEFVLTESLGADDPSTQRIAIAHELTHALQDQHFDLRRFEKLPKGNSDRDLAIQSLIEGDATLTMITYALDGRLDMQKFPVSIGSLLDNFGVAANDPRKAPALTAAPKAIQLSLLFPYTGGADFVQALLRKGGWARVSQAFTDLPESTEQVLHPEKYFARERPVTVTQLDLAALLGPDWYQLTGDVQGEFGYRLILGEFLDEKQARKAAQGWGGDRSTLYEHRPTGQLCLVQVTRWDTVASSQAFFEAYVARTERRFPEQRLNRIPADRSTLEGVASEGVHIERRGVDVFILEGLPPTADLPALLNKLASTLPGAPKLPQ